MELAAAQAGDYLEKLPQRRVAPSAAALARLQTLDHPLPDESYSQCPRKAFLLYTQEKGNPHEYIQLLEQQKQRLQSKYLDAFSGQNLNPQPFTLDNLKRGSDLLTQATLKVKVSVDPNLPAAAASTPLLRRRGSLLRFKDWIY